jgi:hypothetical protein
VATVPPLITIEPSLTTHTFAFDHW